MPVAIPTIPKNGVSGTRVIISDANAAYNPTSWYQPKPPRRQRLSGVRRVGPRNATSFVMEVARSAHRPPTQRAGVQWAMGPDPCAHRI
jgi:hypothetical protein